MNKVVFYHERFPAGGAERITVNIADYIHNKGYEVYVITAKADSYDFKNLKVIEIPEQRSVDSEEADKAINFIIQFINDNKIDIFISILLDTHVFKAIKEKTQCKVIRALHSIPLWESINRYYLRKEASKHFSMLKKIKRHTQIYIDYHWLKKYDRKFIKQYREMYQNIDALTVLCDKYKEQLEKYFKDGSRIHVIPNPEYPREHVNLNKKKQIIFSGRLSYADKRIDKLLTIWEQIYRTIPDWELIIIGDGPERDNLKDLAQKLKLERITFAGYTESIDDYYRDAAILCLTSTFEGWGLCLTEAQANGVIPVAFNCCAGIEYILSPNKQNGILVSNGNIKEFASEIVSLVNNPQLMKQMQQNVLNKINDYSPQAICEKWIALFDKLIKQ